jgi:hypothetical protein
MVKVQGRRNVVAALIPEVGQRQQGKVADGHRRKEDEKQDGRRYRRELGARLANSI